MMKTLEQNNMETVSAFIESFWNQSDMDSTDQFYRPIIKSILINRKKA